MSHFCMVTTLNNFELLGHCVFFLKIGTNTIQFNEQSLAILHYTLRFRFNISSRTVVRNRATNSSDSSCLFQTTEDVLRKSLRCSEAAVVRDINHLGHTQLFASWSATNTKVHQFMINKQAIFNNTSFPLFQQERNTQCNKYKKRIFSKMVSSSANSSDYKLANAEKMILYLFWPFTRGSMTSDILRTTIVNARRSIATAKNPKSWFNFSSVFSKSSIASMLVYLVMANLDMI